MNPSGWTRATKIASSRLQGELLLVGIGRLVVGADRNLCRSNFEPEVEADFERVARAVAAAAQSRSSTEQFPKILAKSP